MIGWVGVGKYCLLGPKRRRQHLPTPTDAKVG